MDRTEAQETLTFYKKFLLHPTFPIKLHFIVKSTQFTAQTQGMGDLMHQFLNVPLALKSVSSRLSFILIIPGKFDYNHGEMTYYYDYRDLEPTEDTKAFIKTFLTPKKIEQKPTSKFDVKNIYNFKEDNRQK